MSDTKPRFSEVLARAMALADQLTEEGYSEDIVLGAVDSESNVLDVADQVIERIIADERLAASARERARRLEHRADQRRDFLAYILRSLGQKRLERAMGTAYFQKNPDKLVANNPDDLPAEYWTRVPDNPRILKDLKADVEVPGYSLAEPSNSLRIKTT